MSYAPNTFFTSPTFRSTFPATFSVVPRSCRSGFPIAFPVSSLTLPATCLAVPFTLSVALEFMLRIRPRTSFEPCLLYHLVRPPRRLSHANAKGVSPYFRLLEMRILVRIRWRAAAKKAQWLCSHDCVPRARRDENRIARADHTTFAVELYITRAFENKIKLL